MDPAVIPPTSYRVALATDAQINHRIRQQAKMRIAHYRNASTEEITRRLEELDREWDTERTLEMNASSLAFAGCALAATVNRKWILLPLAVTGFLFQHAVQGWCPPLPLIRRLGVRTQREIDEERCALKALRGDFQQFQADGRSARPARAAVSSVHASDQSTERTV